MESSSNPAPSLEESRKLHEFGTLDRFKIEAEQYMALADDSKLATNALNRQETQLRNALVAIVNKEALTAEDEVRLGEVGYRYDYAVADKVPPEKLLEMLENEEITRQQFLDSITVQKADAERIIGSLIIGKLVEKVKGTKADVRRRKLENASEHTKEPKIIRVKPEQTVSSTTPKPAPTIKQRPGKSLGGIRKRSGW